MYTGSEVDPRYVCHLLMGASTLCLKFSSPIATYIYIANYMKPDIELNIYLREM